MSLKTDRKYAYIIAPAIINECIDRGYQINTSKLIKLLYYMQKLHIQIYEEPMFTNEIIAGESGPFINDIMSYYRYGVLGFNEKVEAPLKMTSLMDSHEDVVRIVLYKYGELSPIELMKKSLEDDTFQTIYQDGLGKNQIIPYDIMANSKTDFGIKKLVKSEEK